jgi:hypothetical protein
MENRNDVEKILRRFRKKPDESVRQNVLARFRSHAAPAIADTIRPPLWKFRVPAYAVAVLLIVCVAGAFVAGRQSSGTGQPAAEQETSPETTVKTAEEIPWHTTARDLL